MQKYGNIGVGVKCTFIYGVAAMALTGCNISELEQLASEAQTAAAAASATPTPSSTTTTTTATASISGTTLSSPNCSYTASYAYDLGPAIQANQAFQVTGGNHGIPVIETIVQSNATDCPMNVMIPAAGDTHQISVYSVSSSQSTLKIYASAYTQPSVFQLSSSASDLSTYNLTSATPQLSSGNETQIFDAGVVTSATSSADAKMVIEVTYVFETSNGQTPH